MSARTGIVHHRRTPLRSGVPSCGLQPGAVMDVQRNRITLPPTQMVSLEPVFQNIPAELMEALLEASVVEARPATTLRCCGQRALVSAAVTLHLGAHCATMLLEATSTTKISSHRALRARRALLDTPRATTVSAAMVPAVAPRQEETATQTPHQLLHPHQHQQGLAPLTSVLLNASHAQSVNSVHNPPVEGSAVLT